MKLASSPLPHGADSGLRSLASGADLKEFPRIPDLQFALRLRRLREKMQAQRLDLLIIYSNALDPGHVRYLADVVGINESCAMLVPLEGEPILCSGQACQAWSLHKSRIRDVRILPEVGEVAGTEYLTGDKCTFSALFREVGKASRVLRIGVVGTLIFPHLIHRQLVEAFPQAQVVNAEPLMFELRYRKTREEIECMRQAGRILDNAFEAAVSKIQPGWTELEIMAEIVSGILRGGAEDTAVAWTPMIPSGPEHSQLCMNRNTRRQVRESEIICLQAGALYEGYNAALCAPLVLGAIPDEIRAAVQAANAAQAAVIAALRPGNTTKKANAAGKSVLQRAGYLAHCPYALVHNIGCLECESPWMPADQDFKLEEGMTVCIDVFLFRLPWGSFRIEDTFAITSDGADALTRFNRSFIPAHFA